MPWGGCLHVGPGVQESLSDPGGAAGDGNSERQRELLRGRAHWPLQHD